MRTYSSDTEKLNAAIAGAVAAFTPPEDITVTQWADKKRRLSPESSAEPGPWRTSRTPYLKEPMDAFTDPKVKLLVMVASSQVGKSEFELNSIGYIIDQDPSSILYIHPTIDDAKKFSKLRVAPMVRDCKALRAKVADPKSRESGNTILQKSFPGGMLTMCGSNSASALYPRPLCRGRRAGQVGGKRRYRGRPLGTGESPSDHVLQRQVRGRLHPHHQGTQRH